MDFSNVIYSMKDGQCARRPTWRDYIARVDDKDGDGYCVGTYELKFVRNGQVVATFPMDDETAKRNYEQHLEDLRAREEQVSSPDGVSVPSESDVPATGTTAAATDDKSATKPSKQDKGGKSSGESSSVKLSKSLMLAFIANDWRIEKTSDVEAQQAVDGGGNF